MISAGQAWVNEYTHIMESKFVSAERVSSVCMMISKVAVVFALWFMSLNGALASAQQRREAYYFANDRVRTVKLVERKEILQYRVEPLAEKRYRETFFDSDGLTLFQRGMYYRVKESFDGKVQLDFDAGLMSDAGAGNPVHSIHLPASKLLAVREER